MTKTVISALNVPAVWLLPARLTRIIRTNDSFPLLDLPPGEDPRLHPCNNCIHKGYASVALVPIRSKDKIVGLIQMNDRRKGCFTFDAIERFEGIALNIGEALIRKQVETELLEATAKANEMAKQAELANMAKSEFLANMSHENPHAYEQRYRYGRLAFRHRTIRKSAALC